MLVYLRVRSSTYLLFVLVFFCQFLELSSMCDFGGLAHTIGDGHSFDMVVLVLESPCVKAFGLFGELVSVKAGGGNVTFFVSSNFRKDARHRQAPFFC